MKKMILGVVILAAAWAGAEPGETGREAFLKRQAYAEMQRVSGQIDVLQSSHDELEARVARMEGGKGEVGALKSDISALRAEIEGLRREMNRMRQDIMADVTKKVVEIVRANNASQPAARPQPTPRPAHVGACREYVVQSGDTLSLIAQAFATNVSTIKEMNGLKGDNLRIGQKLLVPKK